MTEECKTKKGRECFTYARSICWECTRSAAPEELRCIWDATSGQVPVEGANILWECKKFSDGRRQVGVVVDCPLFKSIYDKGNVEELRRAREDATKKKYAGIGLQQSRFHGARLSENGLRV